MGTTLPIFDSLGEVVGSTRNLLPSTEIRDTNGTGILDKVSKVSFAHENKGNVPTDDWYKGGEIEISVCVSRVHIECELFNN